MSCIVTLYSPTVTLNLRHLSLIPDGNKSATLNDFFSLFCLLPAPVVWSAVRLFWLSVGPRHLVSGRKLDLRLVFNATLAVIVIFFYFIYVFSAQLPLLFVRSVHLKVRLTTVSG